MNKTALAILAKCPLPGKVNTRLQPQIQPEDSARLQEAFILDTLFKVKDIAGIDAFLGSPPLDDKAFFEELSVKTGIKLFIQKGNTLGGKIQNVFSGKFQQGYKKVLIIGVDSPTFPPEFITEASQRLNENDVVFGPSVDGGYYMVGMKEIFHPIFPDNDLGTKDVLKEDMERCEHLGLKISTLSPWYDLDRFPDLEFAATHIRLLEHAGSYYPKHTKKLLEEILGRVS